MDHSVATRSPRTEGVEHALRSRDHVVWLGDVLEVIAVELLGLETPRRLAPHDARRIRLLIGDPVSAAMQAAFDRLSTELAGIATADMPDLPRHAGDDRRRAELGLD